MHVVSDAVVFHKHELKAAHRLRDPTLSGLYSEWIILGGGL